MRKRVKQKGIDTVEIDDSKGYREIGYTRGSNRKNAREGKGNKLRNDSMV